MNIRIIKLFFESAKLFGTLVLTFSGQFVIFRLSKGKSTLIYNEEYGNFKIISITIVVENELCHCRRQEQYSPYSS